MTFQVTKSWKVEEMEITVSWCQWVKVVVKNFTLVALKTTRRSFILSFPKLVAMSKSLDQIMLGRAWTSLLMVKKMEFHQDNFMRFPSNGEMTRNASRGDLLMLLWRPWRLKLWKQSDRNIESTGFETCDSVVWTVNHIEPPRPTCQSCHLPIFRRGEKKGQRAGAILAISLTQSSRNFARFQTSRLYFSVIWRHRWCIIYLPRWVPTSRKCQACCVESQRCQIQVVLVSIDFSIMLYNIIPNIWHILYCTTFMSAVWLKREENRFWIYSFGAGWWHLL